MHCKASWITSEGSKWSKTMFGGIQGPYKAILKNLKNLSFFMIFDQKSWCEVDFTPEKRVVRH